MPGKYLEYIKAGRYVVPVELSFLPTKVGDQGQESSTTKWVDRRHWKEIKAMLKPAVELVAKYNESSTDKISKSPHIAFGEEVALGYVIHLNKDKCPFLAILDPKKNCWTDDEDESDIDENSGIVDLGGRHKSYTPTKCYIKACSLKKTGSQTEDRQKIRKELGGKNDVRSYFPSSDSLASGSGLALSTTTSNQEPPAVTSHEKHKPKQKVNYKKKENAKKKLTAERERWIREDYDSSSEESLIDLPPPSTGCPPWSYERSPLSFRTNDVNLVVPQPISALSTIIPLENLGIVGANVEIENERGAGNGVFSDSVDDVFSTSSLFRNWIEDDDFDEELPDIEETCSHSPRKGKRASGSRKKSVNERKNASGLPDIDEPPYKRTSKKPKKRSIAIVEPMKHMKASTAQMSFEEAVGAMGAPVVERRRKGRATSSPTIERLINNRSKNSAPAIEILGEGGELISSERPQQGSSEKKKAKESPTRKRRPRKLIQSPTNDRLTPSPFPDDSPEDLSPNNMPEESNSGSDLEMPILSKMIHSSDDGCADNNALTPPESPSTVPELEMECVATNEVQEVPTDDDSRSIESQSMARLRRPRSPSPDIADHATSTFTITNLHWHHLDKQQFYGSDNSQISMSHSQSSSLLAKRIRQTSDSDDITSESAYRKTPIRRKRRRKIAPSPLSTLRLSDADSTKETGDAQTQTALRSTPSPVSQIADIPNDDISPAIILNPKLPITKMERCDDSQCYNSDYAQGVLSEGDDDEVLFAGQFQAIPIGESPKVGAEQKEEDEKEEEEEEEEELFSFERPASVKLETLSINSMGATTQTESSENIAMDNDGEFSFDYIATTRGSAVSIDNPEVDANVIEALRNGPPEVEDSEFDHRDQDPGNLSTYQLMNHLGTLQGGFGYLGKVMSKNGKGSKNKKGGKKRPENKQKDSDLMPPPPSNAKRPASPDICSLNPEQRVFKSKFKKDKSREQQLNSIESNRSESPIPGPSSGIRSSREQSHIYQIDSSSDDEESCPRGAEPYFREFMSRALEPEKEYEPQGDEYDLTQSSQCMLTVVQDYAEKSRQYKKHKKNIEELSLDQFKMYFELVKPQILGIFGGTVESERSKLYCSHKLQDRRTLKRIAFIEPFNSDHGNALWKWLYDLVLPQSGSTLKCADYVNYVMRPEALIRIFAYVNNISCDTAEKEMSAGGAYDGKYGG